MSVAWTFFNYPGTKKRTYNNIKNEMEDDIWSTIKRFKKNILMGYHVKSDKEIGTKGSVSVKVQNVPPIVMIGNTSIYNTKNNTMSTNNASESIIRAYGQQGFPDIFTTMRGEYAFWIVDFFKMKVFIGRDPFGLRPLYRMYSRQYHCLLLSTDMKLIMKSAKKLRKLHLLEQFPPGTWEEYTIRKNGSMFLSNKGKHFSLNNYFSVGEDDCGDCGDCSDCVNGKYARKTFDVTNEAILKQIVEGQPKGIFMFDNIDSTWLLNIIWHFIKDSKEKIYTFSVGLKGSPYLKSAADLANDFKTVHHEIVLSEEDIKKYIFNAVYQFKTFDPHTIRNGIGLYFLSKFVAENFKDIVIFTGHGINEIFQIYPHFVNAPNSLAASLECNRLLRNFHNYDGLVLSNMMTEFGVEFRCPFLDLNLIKFITSLDLKKRRTLYDEARLTFLFCNKFYKYKFYKEVNNIREKYSLENQVKRIISKFADEIVYEREFTEESDKITHCKPVTKEAYLYRKVFDTHYKNLQFTIPNYWSPQWSTPEN